MKQYSRAVRKSQIVAAIETNRRVGGTGLTMGKIASAIGVTRSIQLYGIVRELVKEGVLLQRDEDYRPTMFKVLYSINPVWLQSDRSELHKAVEKKLDGTQMMLLPHDVLINGQSYIYHQSSQVDALGNHLTISPPYHTS